MSPMKAIAGFVVAIAALQSMSTALAADENARQRCFFSNQFQSWKAADEKTIYIRVGVNRYYRLDLGGACRSAMRPDAYLVTTFRGTNSICSAIDWDLKVGQHPIGITEPCIVSKMTELTKAEADALPRKVKP